MYWAIKYDTASTTLWCGVVLQRLTSTTTAAATTELDVSVH